ncbi:MAG: hypothetical protein Q9172_004920 [Xanthocarpia lactea]
MDEIDDDREEREDTSEIIDSGDDTDELGRAREDLRADVGNGWGRTQRQDGFGLSSVARGVGSSVLGILLVLVGVDSFEVDQVGSLRSLTGKQRSFEFGGGGLGASSAWPNSRVSSAGVKRGTTAFHMLTAQGEDLGKESVDADGEYFSTISVQRWKTGSGMWSFQFTAVKKAISFALISQAFSPEILLHARAEKLRSWRYLEARMRDERNMRRPHCIARQAWESSRCSMNLLYEGSEPNQVLVLAFGGGIPTTRQD